MADDAVDHNAAGWALLSTAGGDMVMLEQAIAHFQQALAENSENGQALSNLLAALLAAGREGEAVLRAERYAAGGIHDGGPQAENWLGWYYLNKRPDLPRALEHLAKAASWGGRWGVAHLNYAVALERSGDLDGALAEYEAAITGRDAHDLGMAHARMAAIYYGRGWLHHALGSARRAVACEEKAPRGRLDTWRADVVRIENELRAKGSTHPSFDDEIPPAGPLAEVELRLRARETEAALSELERMRAADFNHVIDAIGLLVKHAGIAEREERVGEAIRLLEWALQGYEMYASGASSGGEGMARMEDVKDMRARISRLKVRA